MGKQRKLGTVHFRVDYDGLTQLVRDFWAEGEYTQALAIMTESGISVENAHDVIRGKLKMAPYPEDEDQGWLVPDDWQPNLAACLWGKYPDPNDHKFMRIINRYGVKPLCEARDDIERVVNDLKRTVYSPDKRRLIDYLRKEKRYADEIYEFFNLPFPETVAVDCEPEEVLPYTNPWSVENFRKYHKEALEKKERDSIIGGKVPGAGGLMTLSGELHKKDEIKPKKTQWVLNETHIVYLEITTWVGVGIGAMHYYGSLKDRDNTVELKTILTQKQATQMNRLRDYNDYKKGDEYSGFWSQDEVRKEAVKQWKAQFPHSTLLIEGRSSVRGPQPILEGPEELKIIVNRLAARADEIDWYTYKKHVPEMEKIDQQWEEVMLKFGYATVLNL